MGRDGTGRPVENNREVYNKQSRRRRPGDVVRSRLTRCTLSLSDMCDAVRVAKRLCADTGRIDQHEWLEFEKPRRMTYLLPEEGEGR